MPTVYRMGPYRLIFYSVERDAEPARFWLNPLEVAWNRGFRPPELRHIRGIIAGRQASLLESWHAYFRKRTITVPLAWYPRLARGTESERNDWRLIGGGHGIHWEALDEDISVEGLLAGKPSGESEISFEDWMHKRR